MAFTPGSVGGGGGGGGAGGPAPNTILPTTVAEDYAPDDITILIPRITADVSAFDWEVPEVTDQVTAGGKSAVVTFVEQLTGSPYTALTLAEPLGVAIAAGEPARVDRIQYAEVERDTIDGALAAHGAPTQATATIRSADGTASFTVTVVSRNGNYLGTASNGLRIVLRFGHGARGFTHSPGGVIWTASYATGKPTLTELRNGILQYWAQWFTPSAITGNGNRDVEGNDFQDWQTSGGTAATAGATSMTLDHVLEPIDVDDVIFFQDTTTNPSLGDPKRRTVSAVDHTGAASVVSWANDLEFAYADGSEVLIVRSNGYAQGVAEVEGPRGLPGHEPFYQFSADASSWRNAYATGDIYFRYVIAAERPADDAASWSDAIRFQGPQGIQGPQGLRPWFQYSTDDASWHNALDGADRFIRFAVAAAQPADGSTDWSDGVRFVGLGTIEGDFLLTNRNGNLSSALTAFNGGTITLGGDFATADANLHAMGLRALVEAAHASTGFDPSVIRFRMLSGTTVLAEREVTITSNVAQRYELDAIVAPVGSVTIRADWISGTAGQTVSVTLANADSSVSLYAQVIPRDSIDRTARNLLSNLHTLRATRVDTAADFSTLRTANPPSNIAVATSDFAVTPSNTIVTMTAAQISSVQTGDVFAWDRNSSRWDRIVRLPMGGETGGFTLRSGNGAPADSLGDDGDWYLRTSNGSWFQKSSGAWGGAVYTDMVGTPGSGLTSVATDATLTGDGTSGDPLVVANPFTDDDETKLDGIGAQANRIITYKIGNVYMAQASATPPTKPPDGSGAGNTVSGVVTSTGITTPPSGWVIARPEATAALPNVFDMHVYGYEVDGAFIWQFGTPNRTDRYVAVFAQDEGSELVAAMTGLNFAGAGVTATVTSGVVTVTIPGAGGTPPAQTHNLWAAWSADATFTATEVQAGESADDNTVTIPTGAGNQFLGFWRSDTDGGDPTELHIAGGGNIRNTFGAATNLTVDGVAGKLIVSATTLNRALLGGETARVV